MKFGNKRDLLLAVCLLVSPLCPAKTFIYESDDRSRQRESFIQEASNGMVVAAHPLASQAGLDILKLGGNAVDAAVATSFAISVVRPQSTGIGGGGFLLYHQAENHNTKVYDFRERAPLKASRHMYLDKNGTPLDFTYKGKKVPNASLNGHLAVGTPGLVAGLVKIHKESGQLPLQKVLAPAISLAEKGFTVYSELADAIAERQDVLKVFEGSRAVFFKGSKPLAKGDRLIQKDLATTLKLIAEKGVDGFYRGTVAKKILAEMKRGSGIITQEDLETYEVKTREAVKGDYKGYKIVSMPPPSSGGVHIVQILNILEPFNLARLGYLNPTTSNLLIEAMRHAYADRAAYLGDPDFVTIPLRGLVSKNYATDIFKRLSIGQAGDSRKVKAGSPAVYESPSTTHLSVVDRWGNAVSSTQTINFTFGSGVVAQGTGVVLNDEMDDFSVKPGVPNAYGLVGGEANSIQAKKTMLSSMSPTLVFDSSGNLKLVVGSPGGSRIITATLQTILNVIEYQMPLDDAVHSLRLHHQWLPDVVYIEPGFPSRVVTALKGMGYAIEERDAIGDVQAIARTEKGWIGVSDTRSDGKPLGY